MSDDLKAISAVLYRSPLEVQSYVASVISERDTLRADLAKAQARVAELEAALRATVAEADELDRSYERTGWARHARGVVGADGTSALAAVRLAQRALNALDPASLLVEERDAINALAEAFGEGE